MTDVPEDEVEVPEPEEPVIQADLADDDPRLSAEERTARQVNRRSEEAAEGFATGDAPDDETSDE